MALSNDWNSIGYGDELIIYGTGRIGRRIIPVLKEQFKIPYLIDNKDAGNKVFGIDVVDTGTGISGMMLSKKKIVVTTMKGAYDDIAKSLIGYGLKENEDFCMFERFVAEWNLRWQSRCVISKIDTVITSKCTLRCKNCNIFINHIDHPCDIGIDELKNNFDIFFDSIDYVYEYTLLGGEPFIHENFAEILRYMTEMYKDRIGKINVISNGTVVPSKKILNLLRNNNISVHLSDYTSVVAYEKKLIEVCNVFEDNNIDYYVIPNNIWKDLVYPDLLYTSSNPHAHMLTCGHSTHSVGQGKLYWCDPAYAADRFMGFSSLEDDYIDLKQNKNCHTRYEASINIIKYLLGDVNERGYMSLCQKCAGIGSDNDRIVKVGLQSESHK